MKSAQASEKELTNKCNRLKKELKNVEKKIEKERGPFKERFDTFMNNLKLKRQIYHSGAMVGNDIDKIYSKENQENINKFSNMFTPILVKLLDGSKKYFSSFKLREKMGTLLRKYSQIYEFMSPGKPLCKHEVLLLSVRCVSMGHWFPINFPDQNLKRKFHLLTYHAPEKASKCFTVGMHAEHISESIHPVVNKLKTRYSSVTDIKMKLSLICKNQWISSDPNVPEYRRDHHCLKD